VTFPHSPQPGPRPVPSPGGFRPAPPPGGGFRPGPPSGSPGSSGGGYQGGAPARPAAEPAVDLSAPGAVDQVRSGHPAVDAVLASLANAARLAPAEQIAEYEAAYQVLQETLAGIDR
jgi:hypothetical protein